MFGQYVDGVTALDHVVFQLLQYIEGLFGFYMSQVGLVAKICFALTMGIGAIKLLLGGTDVHRLMVQFLMALMTYFVMIWAFPHLMTGIIEVVSDFAYRSVNEISGGRNIDRKKAKGGDYEDFREWIKEQGGEIDKPKAASSSYYGGGTNWADLTNTADPVKRKSMWENETWGNNVDQAIDSFLNLDVALEVDSFRLKFNPGGPGNYEPIKTREKTTLISMNKLLQYILVVWKLLAKQFVSLCHFPAFFQNFLELVIIGGTILATIFSVTIAIAEYFICLVYWSFLYGVGIIFIPFMLWDGTKHAFEKLCGSMFNIAIRLLLTCTCIYLMLYMYVDVIVNIYYLDGGKSRVKVDGIVQGFEYYLMIICLNFFIIFLVRNAKAIAEFLCGGQPRMGFAEFAEAARSTGGAAGMGAKMAAVPAVLAGGVAGAAGGLAVNMVTANKQGKGAKKQVADAGGSREEQDVAYRSAFGSSMVRSTVNQVGSIGGSLAGFGKYMGRSMMTAMGTGMSGHGSTGLVSGLLTGEKTMAGALFRTDKYDGIRNNPMLSDKEKREAMTEKMSESDGWVTRTVAGMRFGLDSYRDGMQVRNRKMDDGTVQLGAMSKGIDFARSAHSAKGKGNPKLSANVIQFYDDLKQKQNGGTG